MKTSDLNRRLKTPEAAETFFQNIIQPNDDPNLPDRCFQCGKPSQGNVCQECQKTNEQEA